MNLLESHLRDRVLKTDFFNFQGFKLQAFLKGKKIVDLKIGKTYPFYDIASITKIVFTTTYFMDAIDTKKIKYSDKVSYFLPWFSHSQILWTQLINHSAGNEWWQPFYKDINLKLSCEQKFQQMEKFCQLAPLGDAKKAVYSDLDFYLLGSIMQKIEGKPLIKVWQDLKSKFYSETDFHFNYDNKPLFAKNNYAPTENCPWRNKIIQGTVHDENAWSLGGIAPHAGLFGQIDDLAHFGLKLRQSYLNKKNNFVSHKTLKKFSQRSMPELRGDWALGFMIPSQKGSSAGDKFSRKSFGHTGFTGTSLWYDPQRDLLVCLLSNRVHPTRENQGFIQLRPRLHDWIIEELEG
jgi:serine-type D-Ala-D-Ala carboxypeptidase